MLAENVEIKKIEKVYDADTFTASIKGGPKWLTNSIKFRIDGVEAPTKGRWAKCENENKLAAKGKSFLSQCLKEADTISIDIISYTKNRYNVCLYIDDQDYVVPALKAKVLRLPGSKRKWCK